MLSGSRVAELDRLGFVWRVFDSEQRWRAGCDALVRFEDELGRRDVPSNHVAADGFRLGTWVQTRRAELARHPNGISTERYKEITALRLRPQRNSPETLWQLGLQLLRAYHAQ